MSQLSNFFSPIVPTNVVFAGIGGGGAPPNTPHKIAPAVFLKLWRPISPLSSTNSVHFTPYSYSLQQTEWVFFLAFHLSISPLSHHNFAPGRNFAQFRKH